MRNLEKDRGKFKTRSPWFKFFPTDWREGTRTLTAEQRGIYIDCLALMYETDAPLPADDKWMAHALHISIRAWRNALSVLARGGKLIPLQDGWTNSRADDERMKRRSQADQNAMIARSREDQRREKSKKENENNETTPRSVPRNEHHVCARQTSELEIEKEKKVPRPTNVELDAEGPLVGLNGARSQILEKLGHWFGNPDEAADWLRDACERHGAGAVKASYGELTTKIATGLAVAYPISLFETICERRAREAAPAKTFMQLIDETKWD